MNLVLLFFFLKKKKNLWRESKDYKTTKSEHFEETVALLIQFRSSHQKMSFKVTVWKMFGKLSRKHLCWRLKLQSVIHHRWFYPLHRVLISRYFWIYSSLKICSKYLQKVPTNNLQLTSYSLCDFNLTKNKIHQK